MNSKIRLFDDEEAADGHLFNKRRKVRNSPLAVFENCVTDAKTMTSDALYVDQHRRLYKPRIVLTELANGEPIDEFKSESRIVFDVYLSKKLTDAEYDKLMSKKTLEEKAEAQRNNDSLQQKARRLEPGDKLTLKVRKRLSKKDHETVREFQAVVIDVFWGSLVIIDKNGIEKTIPEQNMGVCTVRVVDSFERSLVINDKRTVEKNKFDLPL